MKAWIRNRISIIQGGNVFINHINFIENDPVNLFISNCLTGFGKFEVAENITFDDYFTQVTPIIEFINA